MTHHTYLIHPYDAFTPISLTHMTHHTHLIHPYDASHLSHSPIRRITPLSLTHKTHHTYLINPYNTSHLSHSLDSLDQDTPTKRFFNFFCLKLLKKEELAKNRPANVYSFRVQSTIFDSIVLFF